MHTSVASRSVMASSSQANWPLPLCVTRPKRVRSRYGSQLRLPRLRPHHCWKRPLGQLHVQPTIYMADSFQPARTARLGLAHPRHKGTRRAHIASARLIPPAILPGRHARGIQGHARCTRGCAEVLDSRFRGNDGRYKGKIPSPDYPPSYLRAAFVTGKTPSHSRTFRRRS